MDRKVALTAIVVVTFILSSCILVTFYNPTEDDKELNAIARVNTEGSAIFIDTQKGIPSNYLTIDKNNNITYNVDGWRGKVFGTPGTTTIQHMQLQEIVTEKLGLKFTLYTEGAKDPGCVYYISSVTNASVYISTPVLAGAIVWEPQVEAALNDSARNTVILATTAQLFPEHTCCIIAGSHEYMQNNSDVTVRFLAAYTESVDWVNNALKDKSSAEYAKLVKIAKEKTGNQFSNKIIEDALASVNYTYGMSGNGDTVDTPLISLEKDIEGLVQGYYDLGALQRSMKSLGYSSIHEFSQRFVNDGYLSQALQLDKSASGYSKVSVKVAVIAGDIHQIAIHVGIELGYFDEYGIAVNISSASNGAGVATSLQNGEADFGFMGAPPIVTTVINSGLTHS